MEHLMAQSKDPDSYSFLVQVTHDFVEEKGLAKKRRLTDLLRLDVREKILKKNLEYPPLVHPSIFYQKMWQEIYDDLKIKVVVPPMPVLTEKQMESLEKYNFLSIYIPQITEAEYPKGFIKPEWDKYLDLNEITRIPLEGRWVAIETIKKPHYDDQGGYPKDLLMQDMGKDSRFNTSYDKLVGDVLPKILQRTGFKEVLPPSAEEWGFTANLKNHLREKCFLSHLPDLGSTGSSEWCRNAYVSEFRLHVGHSRFGGLSCVGPCWDRDSSDYLGFRALVAL
jgi:hypothetical protein